MPETKEPRALVLASSSPWRRQVMEGTGLAFVPMDPGIDEKAIRHPDAVMLTRLIAEAKAHAAMSQLGERPALVIASDQVARFRGEIREKPRDVEEARRFLRDYRHATVELVTSVVVLDTVNGMPMDGCDIARLAFGALPDEAIETAIKAGGVLKSCGAIVAEDPAIAPWAVLMQGTRDSVQGLPLDVLYGLLQTHDYAFA